MRVLNCTAHCIFLTVDDFDNTSVLVVVSPGETSATAEILITDDDLLEAVEFFNVVIEVGDNETDGAVVGQPAIAQVAIVSDDG